MTSKETFHPDEWQKLCELPHLVGLAVAGASLSGISGVLAEANSVAQTLTHHKNNAQGLLLSWLTDATSNETAKRLLASTQQNPSTPTDRAAEALRQSLFVLSAKATPEENNAIKTVLLEVAQNVAAAAKEGGFAGFGGEQINDAERAVLATIKTALGI